MCASWGSICAVRSCRAAWGALLPIGRAIITQLKDAWPTLAPEQNKERHADAAALAVQQHPGPAALCPADTEGTLAGNAGGMAAQPQAQVLAQLEAAAASMADVLGSGAKTAAFAIVAWFRTLPPIGENKPAPTATTNDPPPTRWPCFHRPGWKRRQLTPAGARALPVRVGQPDPHAAAVTADAEALAQAGCLWAPGDDGQFRHAAIVYKDIQGSLSSFDPRQYFPLLFGDYYGHVVTNADKLTNTWAKTKASSPTR